MGNRNPLTSGMFAGARRAETVTLYHPDDRWRWTAYGTVQSAHPVEGGWALIEEMTVLLFDSGIHVALLVSDPQDKGDRWVQRYTHAGPYNVQWEIVGCE